MKNKRRYPKPIRRMTDIINKSEIILVSTIFISYMLLIFILVEVMLCTHI